MPHPSEPRFPLRLFMKYAYCLLLIFVCAAAGYAAEEAKLAPFERAAKSGGGVACVARPEYAEAAIALAANNRWVVHVLLPEKKQMADVRQKAEQAGVLGRNLYVEQGTLDRLPYADI